MATLALDDVELDDVNGGTHGKGKSSPVIRVKVAGHVTDAAHGFWHDTKSLLICSSVYSCLMQCWTPIVITYSNGQTAEHYQCHFRVLIQSIAEDADRRKLLPIVDWWFGGVRPLTLQFLALLTWNPDRRL
jgi:hypothetical protein